MKHHFLGLTGNVGSGKTTALNIFKNYGFTTFNADEMVHQMFVKEHPFFKDIAFQIDHHFLTNFSYTGTIDRNILRPLLKEKENSLELLADIVKPFIHKEILDKRSLKENMAIEVPLLFEANTQHIFDATVLVYCGDVERKKRIQLRNPNWTDNHIDFVMNSQMPQDQKLDLADYTIYNNCDDNLNEQIQLLIAKLDKINVTSYQNK